MLKNDGEGGNRPSTLEGKHGSFLKETFHVFSQQHFFIEHLNGHTKNIFNADKRLALEIRSQRT